MIHACSHSVPKQAWDNRWHGGAKGIMACRYWSHKCNYVSMQVIPMDSMGFQEAFNIRVDQLQVLSMELLYDCPRPTVALLYQDNKDARHLRTYEISIKDKVTLNSPALPLLDAALHSDADKKHVSQPCTSRPHFGLVAQRSAVQDARMISKGQSVDHQRHMHTYAAEAFVP